MVQDCYHLILRIIYSYYTFTPQTYTEKPESFLCNSRKKKYFIGDSHIFDTDENPDLPFKN